MLSCGKYGSIVYELTIVNLNGPACLIHCVHEGHPLGHAACSIKKGEWRAPTADYLLANWNLIVVGRVRCAEALCKPKICLRVVRCDFISSRSLGRHEEQVRYRGTRLKVHDKVKVHDQKK